jgi:hypothetical protein
MKFLYKIIFIIISIIIIIKPIFAIEKNSINFEENPVIKNTSKNITRARTIENEVSLFKRNLENIQNKYNIKNDTFLNNSKKELKEIIYILRKIQTTRLEKYTVDFIIETIIDDLKNINLKTKEYFKKIKNKFEEENEKYNLISEQLSLKLNKIVNSFILYYTKKDILNQNDKEVIKIIKSLNEKSLLLKNIKNKNFYNSLDTKKYLIKILKDIKIDFLNIREKMSR